MIQLRANPSVYLLLNEVMECPTFSPANYFFLTKIEKNISISKIAHANPIKSNAFINLNYNKFIGVLLLLFEIN